MDQQPAFQDIHPIPQNTNFVKTREPEFVIAGTDNRKKIMTTREIQEQERRLEAEKKMLEAKYAEDFEKLKNGMSKT